ncbi:MAG: hypothetical protein WC752_01030 [Patescibacteria group bacterium]|jgi:glutathione synthase/RimK-type ligase-like ATP-grasp enzyme
MIKPLPIFDIIIVYDANLAFSAADSTYHESSPFTISEESFNCDATYRYFIQYCKKQGLSVAFTTTKDINTSGQFSSVWTYNNRWERNYHIAYAKVIFDKFLNLLPRNHEVYKRLTTAKKSLPFFHDQKINILFDNKLETHLQLSSYTIPTVKVDSLTKESIKKAKKSLLSLCLRHPFRDDFNSDLVLKDQFGWGGNSIFKIANGNDFSNVPSDSSINFVLQPFIQTSGFNIAHFTGKSDLRVIICNNVIIQSYLRIAKIGDFRANAEQGAKITYLTLDQIPLDVLEMIASIQKHSPNKNALYALDFIKSINNHLYFIEGNSSPGLNWFDPEDERRAKQLIRLIVKKLKKIILL